MANEIKKMNSMRRNILLGVLIGSVIAFVLILYPSIWPHFNFLERLPYHLSLLVQGAIIVWLLTLLIFGTRYWLFKNTLRKDPSLRAAVNDERIKLNWLRAYRFSFYSVLSITIIFKVYEIRYFGFALPHITWLILFAAPISLVGSFLYYNREVKDG